MADYLLRDQAPLSPEQWQVIDNTVTQVASRALVGRRFIPVFGPFGPGLQVIPTDVFTGATVGNVSMIGEDREAEIVGMERRDYTPLPIIYKDFRLHWRDLETSAQFGIPLDTSAAAAAADFCAHAEDNLIFNGNEALGYQGMLKVGGRTRINMSDWGTEGKGFGDVLSATEALIDEGFFGPYALVVSPLLYANLNRVFDNTGVLEIEQVRKIATDGVFQSPLLPEPSGLIIATGPQNLDLVVAQDFTTAFLQSQDMNYYLRVFEIVALRIKRPQAICTLEGGSQPATRPRRRREEQAPQQGT